MSYEVPTKGDSLVDRLEHAFGRRAIERQIRAVMFDDPLDRLTDEARADVVRRLLIERQYQRRILAANRKLRKTS